MSEVPLYCMFYTSALMCASNAHIWVAASVSISRTQPQWCTTQKATGNTFELELDLFPAICIGNWSRCPGYPGLTYLRVCKHAARWGLSLYEWMRQLFFFFFFTLVQVLEGP